MYTGPHLIKDNLVFGYDTGYGIADNSTATRFYKGEPTSNVIPNTSNPNLSVYGWYGYGWSGGMIVNTEENAFELTATNGWHNRRYNHGITSGGTVTVSFDYKLKSLGTDPVTTGHQTYMFILNGTHLGSYTNDISSISHSDFTSGEWKTFIGSYTANSDSNLAIGVRGKDSAGLSDTVYIKNLQVEAKGHRTPFVDGTRSSTQSLIDLKRTTDIDVSNVSFDSTGQPTFDETDDHITGTLPMLGLGAPHTIEMVFSSNVNQGSIGSRKDPFTIGNSSIHQYSALDVNAGYMNWYFYGRDTTFTNNPLMVANKFYHIVLSYVGGASNNTNKKVWINGIQQTLSAGSSETPLLPNNPSFSVGRDRGRNTAYWPGEIPVWKVFQKAFTQEEAQQNYNAYKNRFDI